MHGNTARAVKNDAMKFTSKTNRRLLSVNFVTLDVRCTGNAGTVDEDIDASEMFADLARQRFQLASCFVRSIANVNRTFATNFIRRRLQCLFVEIQQRYVCTFGVEFFGDCQSET